MADTSSEGKLVEKVAKDLASDNHTIDWINAQPDSYSIKQITYYYDICLRTINKEIGEGNPIIEAVVGLNILSYLADEKKCMSTDTNILELIAHFEGAKDKENRKVVTHMMLVASKVVESLEGANYARWSKAMRKRNY
jgi:hypothetical protein